MGDNEFYYRISRELHQHLLTVDLENGSSLEDIIDIDDLIDEIMDILKSNIEIYIREG